MSLFFTSLNSGSNGNCYYVGNHLEAVLIDAGIACKEVEQRMHRLGLSLQLIKGIVVSHEHTDHIKGVEALSIKYQLPVYITASTLKHARLKLPLHLIKYFTSGEQLVIGKLKIDSFCKQHDAIDPCSFIIESNTVRMGIFTDIGSPCANVINQFKLCHAALLETNYDASMLAGGRYPFFLKKRISGDRGHLSNHQALELFLQHRSSFMSHIFLGHLSQHNNNPAIVEDLFREHANGITIVVASRFEETQVYSIGSTKQPDSPLNINLRKKLLPSQLKLVFE